MGSIPITRSIKSVRLLDERFSLKFFTKNSKKGLQLPCGGVIILKQSNGACGSSSVVECHLAKVDVASPNLVYRSISGAIAKW